MIIPKPVKHYLDIPGFNNPKHLEALGEFARNVKSGGRVLEIGCAWGCSTWILLNNLPKDVELHTCDTFDMNEPYLKQKHYNGVIEKHKGNSTIEYLMKMYVEENDNAQRKIFNWVMSQHPTRFMMKHIIHQKKSLEILEKDTNWDLVYIDGLHSYFNVTLELRALKNVKYICGDDYHPSHQGTVRAIDGFLKEHRRKFDHHDFETGSGFWTMIKES